MSSGSWCASMSRLTSHCSQAAIEPHHLAVDEIGSIRSKEVDKIRHFMRFTETPGWNPR
ncbi:MAG: hypothetical protein RLZZ516_2358, partial [Cyanobacteriota bacterium]